MKLVLVVFLCLFFAFNAFAQTEKTEIGVEELSLARGDGSGNAGEISEKFITTDVPIYCIIQLDADKTAAIKMILTAVKAFGLKPETKVVTVSYTTKEGENGVTFNASPKAVWAAGTYRVDVFVNAKLAKSLSFEIEKPANDTKNEKSFAPRKTITKPRGN